MRNFIFTLALCGLAGCTMAKEMGIKPMATELQPAQTLEQILQLSGIQAGLAAFDAAKGHKVLAISENGYWSLVSNANWLSGQNGRLCVIARQNLMFGIGGIRFHRVVVLFIKLMTRSLPNRQRNLRLRSLKKCVKFHDIVLILAKKVRKPLSAIRCRIKNIKLLQSPLAAVGAIATATDTLMMRRNGR